MKMKEFSDYFISKRLLVNIPTFLKISLFYGKPWPFFSNQIYKQTSNFIPQET